ncbi:MAG: helix-turn-helix domain-containing protein [Pseudomonadota bacterium]|nr:helix-turn-helix domain-containing protein [Pseudomonadota bacterium]
MEFVDEENDSEEIDVGKYLKKHRVNYKISIEELSKITKIRIENIIAIEESEKSIHIPQTYYRGYIKSYCKFFGIDAGDILKHIESVPYTPPRSNHSIYKVQNQTLKPFKKSKYSTQKKTMVALTLVIVMGIVTTIALFKTGGLIQENSFYANSEVKDTQQTNKNDLDSIIEIR